MPVQWAARYFPSGGDLIPISRGLSADSLLGALLQKSGSNPGQAGYFTYLGALAELRLMKEQTVAAGHDLRLTEVVLEFQYEFVRRGSLLRTLEFQVNDGLAPYVEVSNEDLGGRQDGWGSFTRTFEAGTSVTLAVPDRMGNLRFAGFEGLDSVRSVAQANHSGPVMLQREVQPAGRRLLSDFDGIQHLLAVNMDNDLTVVARYESIEGIELGIMRDFGSDEPSLRLHLDGERWTPYRLESGPTVDGPWSILDEGVLMGPREEPLPDSRDNESRFYRVLP